jgi:hypothetical protein
MFKISHWPGAGVMLTFGMLFFCIVFLPSAIISNLKSKVNKKYTGLYIIAYFAIFFNFFSALFKIMHWPGAGILLFIGIPLPFILFLPAYLMYNRNEKEINYRNFVAIMFFFAYFAAISALLSVSVSRDTLDESIVSAYQLEQKTSICQDQISALHTMPVEKSDSAFLLNKSSVEKILVSSDQLNQTIENMKVELVKSTNKNNSKFVAADGHFNLWKISGMENSTSMNIGSLTQLKIQLNDFRQLLLTTSKNKDEGLPGYIENLLHTKGDGEKEWEMSIFLGRNVIATIGELNLIKYNVALAELEVVSAMNNNSGL